MKSKKNAIPFFLAIICLLCAIFVVEHCFLMEKHFDRLSKIFTVQTQPGSPSPGILHPIAADGYLWIRNVQDMVNNGEWRLNYTYFDNAPYGREVRWSSGFAWVLMGLGWIYHAIYSIPIEYAIARSAGWANPIILVLCIFILPVLVFRRFGVRAASLLAIGMIVCGDFYENFIPAYPDHHGLISVTALCSILFLLMAGAGWISSGKTVQTGCLFPTSLREARYYIYFSAFFSAVGLWTSMVSQIMLIAGISIGVILSVVFLKKQSRADGLQYFPHLWALWGRVGAGFALFFYLLEYFPDRMGMQLLANHPIYGLLWLGSGEALTVLTKVIIEKRRPGKKEVLRLVGAGILVLILPVAILFGNPAWWSLRDPFLIALHNDILEFRPLFSRLNDGSLNAGQLIWGQFFFLAPGIVLLFFRRLPAGYRALILFTLTPALVFNIASLYQTRWSIMCGPVFVALLPLVFYAVRQYFDKREKNGKKIGWYVFTAVLVLCAISSIKTINRAQNLASLNKRVMLSLGEAVDLLTRDIAFFIKNYAHVKKPVLLSSPNETLRVCYFGHMCGIGTLYWENLPGLKAAAELFSTLDESHAHDVIKERGITHILFLEAPGVISPFIEQYCKLAGLANEGLKPDDGFANRLFYKKDFPAWLKQLPYPQNQLSNYLQAEVVILEVTN